MGMKNSLFWRLFWALLGALVTTMAVLALTKVTMVRAERRQALESEVRLQARDVAQLIKQRGLLTFWQDDAGLRAALNWKIEEIRGNYQAEVWLINSAGYALVLGGSDAAEKLIDPGVIAQIQKVLSGEEIRVKGLIPALGESVVTIGVPWYGSDGRVYGAVLLHIGLQSLEVDYSDILRYVAIAGVLSMALGTILAYLIASRQSKPLRRIQRAVADFAAGRLDRRVEVTGHDEVAQLAQSFNRMAEDLSNQEESRRAFVANVSHELRSPMTSIQGYIQGILDGTIPGDERQKYLAVVLDETQRLTKLVNGLLELSKYESGAMPLNVTRFDLNELILSTLFKFEQRIEAKGLEV
ncbi:MAG: HAMP domain-containing protein, partial [Clostridiales bacterium]|nr:HAMP domain-containing protein [Clostridiales bacterium]